MEQDAWYSYDANDRLTSVSSGYDWTSYAYDANGATTSVTGSESATYAYDLEGRLVHAVTNGHTIDYAYDDDGHRVSQTVDGQKTTYLNDVARAFDQVLEEYAPGGILAATYVRGIDLLFQDRSGTRSYYAKDGLGSTRALTDASGAVTDTYVYDADGGMLRQTGSTVNGYLFAGERRDAATGLDYLRARYLSTAVGRFTSRDTYDGRTADPTTLNHYLYAGADPVNNTDPSGHRVLPGREKLVGTFVHSFLSRQFESPGGKRALNRWGNRYISTISREIGPRIPTDRRRPDAAQYYGDTNTGDLYEFKHVPGDDIGSFLAVGAGLLDAMLDLPTYETALEAAVPGSKWGPGSTWMTGSWDWGAIATVVPRTAGLTSPGDHLVTFSAYWIAPGALVWASVPSGTKWYGPAEFLSDIIGLGLISSVVAEIVKENASTRGMLMTTRFIASVNVTGTAISEVGAGAAIATANSPSGVA